MNVNYLSHFIATIMVVLIGTLYSAQYLFNEIYILNHASVT